LLLFSFGDVDYFIIAIQL